MTSERVNSNHATAHCVSIETRVAVHHLARILVGALLITAAILKGRENADEPLVSASWLLTIGPLVLILTELILGSCLLVNVWPVAVRRCVLVLLIGFAVVSAVRLYRGEPKCDCFGAYGVSPLVSLLVDLMAGAILFVAPLVGRPPRHEARPGSRWEFVPIVFAGLVLCPLVFWPSQWRIVAGRLVGPTIVVRPLGLDSPSVGENQGEEMRVVRIRVFNASSDRVRIVGGASGCGSFVGRDLPVELEPHGSRDLPILVWQGPGPAKRVIRYVLLTDRPGEIEGAFTYLTHSPWLSFTP